MSEPKPTPPPAPAPTPAPAPVPEDPSVKALRESFEKVITPSALTKNVVLAPIGTLSDAIEQSRKDAKEKAAAPAPAPTPTPTPPAAPPAPEPPPIRVVKKPEPAPQAPPAPAPAPVKTDAEKAQEIEAARKLKEEEAYVAGLEPEQQEELKLARYAEANGQPGKFGETLAFYKKVDQFMVENPEADATTEAYVKFVQENQPKWNPADRRRLDRKMLTEEVASDVEKKFEPVQREVKALRSQPLIEAAMSTVESTLTVADPDNKDLVPVPKEIVDLIKTQGLQAAIAEYPVEAPIISGTLNAANTWMRLSTGVEEFNEQNPLHLWVVDFVHQETKRIQSGPKEAQLLNKRQFVPKHEYRRMEKEQPEQLAGVWTFSDEMVADMIAMKGLQTIEQTFKNLEKSNQRRKPAAPPSPTPPTPPAPAPSATATNTPPVPSPGDGGPSAGARPKTGASDDAPPPNDGTRMLEKLIPGGINYAMR